MWSTEPATTDDINSSWQSLSSVLNLVEEKKNSRYIFDYSINLTVISVTIGKVQSTKESTQIIHRNVCEKHYAFPYQNFGVTKWRKETLCISGKGIKDNSNKIHLCWLILMINITSKFLLKWWFLKICLWNHHHKKWKHLQTETLK